MTPRSFRDLLHFYAELVVFNDSRPLNRACFDQLDFPVLSTKVDYNTLMGDGQMNAGSLFLLKVDPPISC